MYYWRIDEACQMAMQIDDNDPNASLTRCRVEAIHKACISSGLLNKRFVIIIPFQCWFLFIAVWSRMCFFRGRHMYDSRSYNSVLVNSCSRHMVLMRCCFKSRTASNFPCHNDAGDGGPPLSISLTCHSIIHWMINFPEVGKGLVGCYPFHASTSS